MREYELTVVYDLALQEAGGPDASAERLRQTVESRGGGGAGSSSARTMRWR